MPLLESCERDVAEVVHLAAGPFALEGRLSYPESAPPRGGVVLAGPHPLLGGDLENNVVRGLSAGLARRGVAVLAFNYRGVGGSEEAPPDVAEHVATFWATSHVPDEPAYAEDLRNAFGGLGDIIGNELPVALVGYSFGCSLLPAVGAGCECPMVLVAPTVGTHDYSTFENVPNPLLVIAPQGDFAIDAVRLAKWFDTLTAPKRLVRGEWDDHFFRGFEDELAGLVFEFLRGQSEVGSCH